MLLFFIYMEEEPEPNELLFCILKKQIYKNMEEK